VLAVRASTCHSYTYDATGVVATITNALGHVTTFTGDDADGRPRGFTGPNRLVTKLTYNVRGEVTSRDVGGEVTSYRYDRAGQLNKTINPDGSYLAYTYGPVHRRHSG
jgi:YD repeat-containing protein